MEVRKVTPERSSTSRGKNLGLSRGKTKEEENSTFFDCNEEGARGRSGPSLDLGEGQGFGRGGTLAHSGNGSLAGIRRARENRR